MRKHLKFLIMDDDKAMDINLFAFDGAHSPDEEVVTEWGGYPLLRRWTILAAWSTATRNSK
jgi:hypothetical protein